MLNDRIKGMALIFATVLCFSIGGLLIKFSPWNGLAITAGRSFFAVMTYVVYMAVMRHRPVINVPTLIGAFSVSMDFALYIQAAKMTTIGNALVLENTAPIFVVFFSWLLLKIRPTNADIAASIAVFVGVVIFFVDSLSAGNMAGNMLALASGFFYSIMMLMKKLKGCDQMSAFFFGFLFTILLGAGSVAGMTDWSASAIGGLALLGIVQVGLAYVLFDIGSQYLKPIETSLICTFEPVLSTVLVALFYGEYMTPVSIAGAVIVFGTISIYQLRQVRGGTDET
ncbi:MAG: EamA family transporter [Eubacteriales bacterium]|nr:EamA family transporter [Eubacteriales bacterium]